MTVFTALEMTMNSFRGCVSTGGGLFDGKTRMQWMAAIVGVPGGREALESEGVEPFELDCLVARLQGKEEPKRKVVKKKKVKKGYSGVKLDGKTKG